MGLPFWRIWDQYEEHSDWWYSYFLHCGKNKKCLNSSAYYYWCLNHDIICHKAKKYCVNSNLKLLPWHILKKRRLLYLLLRPDLIMWITYSGKFELWSATCWQFTFYTTNSFFIYNCTWCCSKFALLLYPCIALFKCNFLWIKFILL